MTDWSIPNWGEPWHPEVEIPLLRSLAALVEERWPHIHCSTDFATVGAAFIEFYTNGVCIGRACVSVIESGSPHFSYYLGATEDEFHGYNIEAAASVVGHYSDALPDIEA